MKNDQEMAHLQGREIILLRKLVFLIFVWFILKTCYHYSQGTYCFLNNIVYYFFKEKQTWKETINIKHTEALIEDVIQ